MDTSSINYTFNMSNNILMGLRNLDLNPTSNCINIGDLILKSFISNPNFIGQVDAETEETNTFQDMREKSMKCALWMQKSGIRPNDVIMICTNNQLEAYIPFLAALYIGAVVSPLDQYYVEENLSYFLEQVKPAMLFIDEKFYMTAFHSTNQLKFSRNIPCPTIIVFPDKNIDLLNKNKFLLETILNDNYNLATTELSSCANVTNTTIAMILFTSGTTGFPKCIKIPYLAFMASPDQHAPHIFKNDIALLFESLCFINGIFITIQAILLHVTIIRIKSQFDAGIMCKIIEKYKVTWMFLETSMCCRLIKSGEIGKHDVSSLKKVIFSGSVNSYKVHIGLKILFPDASIFQAYSLTETGIIAYQRQTKKIGSSGLASPNVRLKIICLETSSQEILLGPNAIGEICCMSPYMMINENIYGFNKKFVSTWFKTGDVGYYDNDGEIYVIERNNECFQLSLSEASNRIINIIPPIIIENILRDHKAVFEVVVTSIWGSNNDKYPIAFVSLMFGEEATEMELKQFVLQNSTCSNELRNVIFLPHLPHFSNGKVNRKLLYDIARSDIFWKRYVLD